MNRVLLPSDIVKPNMSVAITVIFKESRGRVREVCVATFGSFDSGNVT